MVVDELSEADVDRLFHALADATRRDIVRQVLVAEQSISALARRYEMSMTAVQKHIGVLEVAGLITKHRQGREQRIACRGEALRQAQGLLDEFEGLWRQRLDRFGALLTDTTKESRT
jgi:DNA-binding transcriptional ArsR family regulator